MKIEDLITYIKENFPNGCKGTECKKCPLDVWRSRPGSKEDRLCDLLSYLHDTDSSWSE